MRINYRIIASDYYIELCQKGVRGRKKGGAFLMYGMDGELGNYHSERFYAEVWGVSASTAHEWIKDFDHELDRFEAARSFRRDEHKRYVKKLTEQIEQSKSSKSSTRKARNIGQYEDTAEQIEQSKSSKDILVTNNNNMREKLAKDFFDIYRLNNGKYTGSRNDAIAEYINVDDVSHSQLLFALRAYKESCEQMVGAAKFLRDRVYLSYVKIRLRAFVDGSWILGDYDSGNAVFVCDNGTEYRLTPERMTEKFAKGELEFARSAA